MDDTEDCHAQERVVEHTEGREGLEALRGLYQERLQRRSDDFAATQGLRLVTAKLQRVSYGPSVVTRSS